MKTKKIYSMILAMCLLFSGIAFLPVNAQAATSAGKTLCRNTLNAQGKKAYDYIKAEVIKIAAGKRTSTKITIPLSVLGISKTGYTAEDLGVKEISDGTQLTQEALTAMRRKISADLPSVVSALFGDCPYELYWYDRTKGTAYSTSPSMMASNETGEWRLEFASDLSVNLSVAEPYAGSNSYTVDSSKTTTAVKASAYAKQIVSDNAGKSDYEKLKAYKDVICKAVTYDEEAAVLQGSDGNQDAWQLVNVFDRDSSTNVVCEGYAKAFQYLCDLSDFSDPDLTCICASGTMSTDKESGAHMWNVVRIGSANYIADLTNSDDGGSGSYGQLFLTGTSKNSSDIYTFSWSSFTVGNVRYAGHSVSYTYDASTKKRYSAGLLKLSASNYKSSSQTAKKLSAQKLTGKSAYTRSVSAGAFMLNAKSNVNATLSYQSSAPKIVSVSAKGKVTPKKAGTAKITVTAKKTGYTTVKKTITIKVTGLAKNKSGVFGSGAAKAVYRITGADTASYISCKLAKKKAAALTVPDTIRINGATYRVTAVSKKAAAGYKKLKKVTIGKNVHSIGANAFAKDKKLKKLTVKTILLKASGCRNCLKGSKISKVKVPAAAKSRYKSSVFLKSVTGRTVKIY